MYPQIFTIATACNGIPECLNDSDENILDEDSCNTDSVTTPILVGAMFLVLGLFFGIKIPHYVEFIENKNGAKQETCQFEELIQRLRENPEDQNNNKKVNSYLLHIRDHTGIKTQLLLLYYAKLNGQIKIQVCGLVYAKT